MSEDSSFTSMFINATAAWIIKLFFPLQPLGCDFMSMHFDSSHFCLILKGRSSYKQICEKLKRQNNSLLKFNGRIFFFFYYEDLVRHFSVWCLTFKGSVVNTGWSYIQFVFNFLIYRERSKKKLECSWSPNAPQTRFSFNLNGTCWKDVKASDFCCFLPVIIMAPIAKLCRPKIRD